MRPSAALSWLILLSACNRGAEEQQPAIHAPANEIAGETATAPPESNLDARLPDDRTPLEEPNGPIDPKSAEAAGQVVQHYGALIEQRRMAEAAKLWGNSDSASDFAVQLRRYPEAHMEIGKPGRMEGAAGSIYVTVPAVFYGKDENGAGFRRAAEVILRRANDVPGSTAEQRRWHIERIDWKP
jgi:hypothetical protein